MLARLDVKAEIILWLNPEKLNNLLHIAECAITTTFSIIFFLASKFQLEIEIGIKWPDQNITFADGAKYKTLDACV